MTEAEILARLVAFPTITDGPNLEMISWVSDHLEGCGFTVTRVPSACGTKAGLLARFGAGPGGVLLSAHSDVVPVAGQAWSTDPFTLTRRGDRLVGRGATDMKGFLACALALAGRLKAAPPARPVMIALSWDEEIGCRGIPGMIDRVIPVLGRPDLCIVGEPTSMRLCTGHKGKASYLATCRGEPGHSAMAPNFVNALHLAADLIGALRAEQARLLREGAQDAAHDMPCSTVHAGKMSGGVALNMVPELAEVAFEIRHLAEETAEDILARIAAGLPRGIEIARTGSYPGLSADPADPAIAALAGLLPDPAPVKVAYGTEAGFFAGLGIPTAVCGPGTMKDGHQPDESIALCELEACRSLLARLA
ncbi:acetylornithine deacetylase [Mangrovicoccus algicola]|uniref:Acetylornithine deacetylase n=1 Tax=Mangrovicoccus algicola TaxID=2771008 RepID=A0A8J7CKV9_9RHOB|nr:acetylornithine deacetylase [Mangrovicoccus algicola]MBE3639301.1 acetylornithine deacetylase [Mangrovicoccus algicola]